MLKQVQKYTNQTHLTDKITIKYLSSFFEPNTINYILEEYYKKSNLSISNLDELNDFSQDFRENFINNTSLMSRGELAKILEEYLAKFANKNVVNEVVKVPVEGPVKKRGVKKKSIPLALKKLVWNKYIGEVVGKAKCTCCELTDITQISFHCGHIVAEVNGGELSVNNLMPICQNCNSSMGSKNLLDFKAMLHGGL